MLAAVITGKENLAALDPKWKSSLVKTTRLMYSLDWNDTLHHLLSLEAAREALHAWLLKHSPEHEVLFDIAYAVDVRLARCTSDTAITTLATALGETYLLDGCPPDTADVLAALYDISEIASSELAAAVVPAFVTSKACATLVETLLDAGCSAPPSADDGAPRPSFIFDPKGLYAGPALSWLTRMAHFGGALPAMVSVTDLTRRDQPLVYVNDAFCRATGYAREAAVGRNCRFLQGGASEPQSVQVISAALSGATDCVVKLVNYRRSGEAFDMLLALRAVADEAGTPRFCIGLHFELTPATPVGDLVTKLGKLIGLFPARAPL